MRRNWLFVSLFLAVIVTAAYATLTGFARPAPNHPFFDTDGSRTQIIAHRGGAGLRPENTLPAFRHAIELGADVLEMDVQRTADGAIVLMHDRTVERTTNGRGAISALTLDELRALDAGYNWSADGHRTHPFRGKGIRVPTLEEVFARFPSARMNIEMKYAQPTFARPLCALIRSAEMGERVLVASMNDAAVAAFRQVCPEVATSMSRSEARLFFGIQLIRLDAAYTPPVRALQIPDRIGGERIVTVSLVTAAHRRNLKLYVWTINDGERMDALIRMGVDGIITDRPDRLASIVLRRGATAENQ